MAYSLNNHYKQTCPTSLLIRVKLSSSITSEAAGFLDYLSIILGAGFFVRQFRLELFWSHHLTLALFWKIESVQKEKIAFNGL